VERHRWTISVVPMRRGNPLPAKRLIRYLSTRTAAAITLPGYPGFPDPGPGSR